MPVRVRVRLRLDSRDTYGLWILSVYAIEATVHAPTWEGVYGEIMKVLKPGGIVRAQFPPNSLISYPNYVRYLVRCLRMGHDRPLGPLEPGAQRDRPRN